MDLTVNLTDFVLCSSEGGSGGEGMFRCNITQGRHGADKKGVYEKSKNVEKKICRR